MTKTNFEIAKDFYSTDNNKLIRLVLDLRSQLISLKGQQTKLLDSNNRIVSDLRRELDDFYKQSHEIRTFILNADTRIHDFIVQETKATLDKEGLRNIVRTYVKDILNRDEIITLTKEITEQVISRLNKNIERELKITKQICYSVETEIKDLSIKLPMNYSDSEKIKNRISNLINTSIKKLESKEYKLLETKT